jgi:hypothetical protein
VHPGQPTQTHAGLNLKLLVTSGMLWNNCSCCSAIATGTRLLAVVLPGMVSANTRHSCSMTHCWGARDHAGKFKHAGQEKEVQLPALSFSSSLHAHHSPRASSSKLRQVLMSGGSCFGLQAKLAKSISEEISGSFIPRSKRTCYCKVTVEC